MTNRFYHRLFQSNICQGMISHISFERSQLLFSRASNRYNILREWNVPFLGL